MSEESTNKPTQTNLEHLDALTDDMIDTSDIPPLTDKFFSNAKWRMPDKSQTETITINVELDVIDWYKRQGGESYQTLITQALRDHMQNQESGDLETVLRRVVREELQLANTND